MNMENHDEIQESVQRIKDNLQKLKDKQIYELSEGRRGVPKCATIASNIEGELQRIIDSYEEIIDEKKQAADRERFDNLTGMLRRVSMEIKDLAKKKPDAGLNAFKVERVNMILMPLKVIMEGEISSPFLEVVQEPEDGKGTSRNSYSDVSIILCQYEQACSEYRDKYYNVEWKKAIMEAGI